MSTPLLCSAVPGHAQVTAGSACLSRASQSHSQTCVNDVVGATPFMIEHVHDEPGRSNNGYVEDVVGATPVHGSKQDEFDSSVADVVLAADAMHDTEFNAAQLTPAPFLGAAVAGLSPCEEKIMNFTTATMSDNSMFDKVLTLDKDLVEALEWNATNSNDTIVAAQEHMMSQIEKQAACCFKKGPVC